MAARKNSYERGLDFITRFGKLFHMENNFYRLRPMNNGKEVTPGNYWDKLVRGRTPKPEERITIELYDTNWGKVKKLCYVAEVRTSRLGLDEVIIPWLSERDETECLLEISKYLEDKKTSQ
jgi:hypothetical protein